MAQVPMQQIDAAPNWKVVAKSVSGKAQHVTYCSISKDVTEPGYTLRGVVGYSNLGGGTVAPFQISINGNTVSIGVGCGIAQISGYSQYGFNTSTTYTYTLYCLYEKTS